MPGSNTFLEATNLFLSTKLEHHVASPVGGNVLDSLAEAATRVPAYVDYLTRHKKNPEDLFAPDTKERPPATSKPTYIAKYALHERCLDGRLDFADTMAVSSGTTGQAVMWPRSLADEYRAAFGLEQVFRDSFQADKLRTLAVICFPLGTWVGGLHTISTLRLLASKGYGITVLAPGTNMAETHRCLTEIAPLYEQTILCGYPPYVRDVVDAHVPTEVDPAKIKIKLLLAGEAISESWRSDMCARLHFEGPGEPCVSMYGTADASIVGFETSTTIALRRMLAASPNLSNSLFGRPDLPSLFQYQPGRLLVEEDSGKIILSALGVHPHFRYDLGDVGTAESHASLLSRLKALGAEFAQPKTPPLPFVLHYGRLDKTVSFFGGQVYPEHVASLLDRSEYRKSLTGRFTVVVRHGASQNEPLLIVVEAHQGVEPTDHFKAEIESALEAHLVALNSEYANYVPLKYRRPTVEIRPHSDAEYFARGKKQVYVKAE